MDHDDALAADASDASEPPPAGPDTRAGRGPFVRDPTHRFPGRRHALKVLYDDVEVASVRAAVNGHENLPAGGHEICPVVATRTAR
jgi:hypothetical protein